MSAYVSVYMSLSATASVSAVVVCFVLHLIALTASFHFDPVGFRSAFVEITVVI